jgi:hypothetical protein
MAYRYIRRIIWPLFNLRPVSWDVRHTIIGLRAIGSRRKWFSCVVFGALGHNVAVADFYRIWYPGFKDCKSRWVVCLHPWHSSVISHSMLIKREFSWLKQILWLFIRHFRLWIEAVASIQSKITQLLIFLLVIYQSLKCSDQPALKRQRKRRFLYAVQPNKTVALCLCKSHTRRRYIDALPFPKRRKCLTVDLKTSRLVFRFYLI